MVDTNNVWVPHITHSLTPKQRKEAKEHKNSTTSTELTSFGFYAVVRVVRQNSTPEAADNSEKIIASSSATESCLLVEII